MMMRGFDQLTQLNEWHCRVCFFLFLNAN